MIGKNSYKGNRGRRWDFFVQDIFEKGRKGRINAQEIISLDALKIFQKNQRKQI
jgi:hypothetical protein